MKDVKVLNINELDYVAGGSTFECVDDSFELWDRQFLNDHWNTAEMLASWSEYSQKIDQAWSKAGVEVVSHPIRANKYKLNGKYVSRETALDHLAKNFNDRRRKL